MLRCGVIGIGTEGSKYASLIYNGKVEGCELAALTRIKDQYKELLQPAVDAGIAVYESADALFEAVEMGELALDAVIITTPHYSHADIAIRAFRNGLHVLSDKPAGVYSRQAREMNEAADDSSLVFGMVFNQRTHAVYQKMYDIVHSGQYGQIKRVNWLITDWYRPESYFKASSWHATWDKDGGGVLLNQCSHNLDLLQWICGMPASVQGFCHEGKYVDIEVEDDATVYMEWENGATGTFITSTGEAPGVNRFEIFLEDALLVCDKGNLRIAELEPELGMRERDYRKSSQEFFKKIHGSWHDIDVPIQTAQYETLMSSFADECRGIGKCIADGREGWKSLLITNAIYLSSWHRRMIDLPKQGSEEELAFEKLYESELAKRCKK